MEHRRGLAGVLDRVENWDRRYDLSRRLSNRGGWRGLFDPWADEWKRSTMNEKFEFLREIMDATGLSLKRLIDIFKEEYQNGRPDISNAADHAVPMLLESAIRELVRGCHA